MNFYRCIQRPREPQDVARFQLAGPGFFAEHRCLYLPEMHRRFFHRSLRPPSPIRYLA